MQARTFLAVIGNDKGKKKPSINAKSIYHDYVQKYEVGDKVWITLDPRSPKRSIQSNNLYWAYLTYIAEQLGEDKDYWHYEFAEILKYGKYDNKGRFIPKSTTSMKKGEFAFYLKKIERECSIPIPDTENFMMTNIYGEDWKEEVENKIKYPESKGETKF